MGEHQPVPRFPLSALLAGLVFWAVLAGARGCVAISSKNLEPIESENAVIIWDSAAETEHFIRQAVIDSDASTLGFIVPTPRRPQLAVADAKIFELVQDYLPQPNTANSEDMREVKAVGPAVVVAEQEVGDYHAVTLQAADSRALGAWLKHNGYTWNAAAAKWLEPYARAHWMINAFKLVRKSHAPFKTRAIRMSFRTDRPFFPYSEPQSAGRKRPVDRTLQIAILAPHHMAGHLADGTSWPGQVVFTKNIGAQAREWMKDAGLDSFAAPDSTWLSYYTDLSNPRPGKVDLFFFPREDVNFNTW